MSRLPFITAVLGLILVAGGVAAVVDKIDVVFDPFIRPDTQVLLSLYAIAFGVLLIIAAAIVAYSEI